MQQQEIEKLGDALYEAMRSFQPIAPLTEQVPSISLDDAYHTSLQMLKRRVEDDGEVVVGKKIGVTSKVVQDMLGVHQPDFGFLTDAMAYANGADVPVAGNMIQPRAEAEIGFKYRVLKSSIHGFVIGKSRFKILSLIMPLAGFMCLAIAVLTLRNWICRILKLRCGKMVSCLVKDLAARCRVIH